MSIEHVIREYRKAAERRRRAAVLRDAADKTVGIPALASALRTRADREEAKATEQEQSA